jgi:hypothetical protein
MGRRFLFNLLYEWWDGLDEPWYSAIGILCLTILLSLAVYALLTLGASEGLP